MHLFAGKTGPNFAKCDKLGAAEGEFLAAEKFSSLKCKKFQQR